MEVIILGNQNNITLTSPPIGSPIAQAGIVTLSSGVSPVGDPSVIIPGPNYDPTVIVPPVNGTGGGGVSVHSALAGLNANDHPQYQQTSGMSNYALSGHTHSQYQSTGAYLTTAALSDHTHDGVYLGTTYTSHTHPYLGTSQSSLFRHTSADSQLQFTSANTIFMGSEYSSHTHPQYVNTSQSSLFQHTSATSAITANAFPTANTTNLAVSSVQSRVVQINGSSGNISFATGSSLSSSSNGSTITFGLASNITTALQSAGAYLTTAAASNHSHGFSASGGSSAFQTLNFANSNGITFSNTNASVRITHDLQYTSQNSLSLGTAAAASFLSTSQSSLFQHTSATSAITANAMNTNERNNYFYTSNNTFANSTHVHGNPTLNLTNLSGTTASNSGGLTLSLSAASYPGGINGIFDNAGNSITNGSIQFVGTNGVSLTYGTGANSRSLYVTHGLAGTGFTGVNATGTLNSNGLSLQVAAPGGGGGAAIEGSGTYSQNTGTVKFQNSNSVTFGLSTDGVMTASIPNFRTANVGLNTARTNVTWTVNSSGISIDGSGYAGTLSTFGGTNISGSITQNSVGLNLALSVGNYLTNQSNQAFSASGGSSAFQTLNFANSNGITFSNSNGSVIASHNALTTAAQSNHSHGNPTLALTNLSGTTASASNGLTLSLSAAAPGAGGGVAIAGSNTTYTSGTVYISGQNMTVGTSVDGGSQYIRLSAPTNGGNLYYNDSNGVSWGSSVDGVSTTITASVNAGGGGAAIQGSGTYTQNTGTVQFANSNGVTFGLSNNGVMTASVNAGGGGVTLNYFNPRDAYVQVAGQIGQGSMHMQPMQAPNVTFDRLCVPVIYTNASNSTGSITMSLGFGIYTRNVSTFSLLSSTSHSHALSFSGTGGNWLSQSGLRLFTIPWSSSLSEDQYYVGYWSRTTSAGANASFSNAVASQMNSTFAGILGAATNASIQYTRGLGMYSATFSTALPSAVPITDLRGNSSAFLRQPLFYFVNGTF